MLEQGVFYPSKSQYARSAFLVPKIDGAFRMVFDYRKVNDQDFFDSHTMPYIDQAFVQ